MYQNGEFFFILTGVIKNLIWKNIFAAGTLSFSRKGISHIYNAKFKENGNNNNNNYNSANIGPI